MAKPRGGLSAWFGKGSKGDWVNIGAPKKDGKFQPYAIQNKKSGFYHLLEFTVTGEAINELEVAFRREERVMRYLTVALDKHAIAWAERRRKRDNIKTL